MVDAEEAVKINPKIKTITEVSPDLKCQFCRKNAINDLEWGPMYQLGEIVVHYYCVLFSAALTANGNEDEGILGFLESDLKKEMKRGARLRCNYCKKTGATVGCIITACKAKYHFPCGLAKGTLNQFTENYKSFCQRHKRLPKLPFKVPVDGVLCEVCHDNVLPTENWVWPPCCKHRLYHRSCMQEYAKRAGYSFACPSCKTTGEFIDAMKKSGIYVPDQDAAWERDPASFQQLTEMYSKCDAEVCYCPEGRKYDADKRKPVNRNWKIVRCGVCCASAVHYCCGQLKVMEWKCGDCFKVMPGSIANWSESIDDSSEDSDVEPSVLEEYEKVGQNLICGAAMREEAQRAHENFQTISEGTPRTHALKKIMEHGDQGNDRLGSPLCDSKNRVVVIDPPENEQSIAPCSTYQTSSTG